MDPRDHPEDGLLSSRDFYRTILERMDIGCAHIRMIFQHGEAVDWDYLDVNAAFSYITRLKGVVGRKISELLPELRQTAPDVFALYGRVARTGTAEILETYVDGLGIWMLLDAFPVGQDEVVVTFTDISKRRAAEDTMAECSRMYDLLVQKVPAAIAVLDTELRYLKVSDRWVKDFRLDPVDLLGRSHYDLFPELPAHWKAILERCLGGAAERCEEEAFVRQDGLVDWVRWEVLPWRKGTGAIGGILILAELVTFRKLAEQELFKLL